MRLVKLGLVAISVASVQATPGAAQSPFQTQSDPAEIHGYRLDVEERDGSRTAKRALEALKEARATAEEIQMLYSIESFNFIAVGPQNMNTLRPEIANRQADLSTLRTAIEASALFHTAMRSEGLNAGDVIGVELSEVEEGLPSEKRATVFLTQK